MKPYQRRFGRPYLFNVLLLCFSIVITLLVSETVLRFAFPPGYYIYPPHLKHIFIPYQNVMPGISGQSVFMTNSLGLRGNELKAAHTYRILTIGGSTTICDFLDQSETWPFLLEKTLNENTMNNSVWVGNAGKGGMTTRSHIVAMKYLPLKEMKIDAVIPPYRNQRPSYPSLSRQAVQSQLGIDTYGPKDLIK